MEAMFKPPEPLSLEGNVSENWNRFVQRFELFSIATDLESKEEARQIAVLLHCIGEDGLDVYNTLTLSATEKKSLKSIKETLGAHFAPKKNVIYERFLFNSIKQKEGQKFDSFLTELKVAVKSTEYNDKDDMVRDRIVFGIRDKSSQERLLRHADLKLDSAIALCRGVEASQKQVKEMQEEASVSALRSKHGKEVKKCNYCGFSHKKGKCPAYGKSCSECGRENHFASVCMNKDKVKSKTKTELKLGKEKHKNKRVHTVKKEESEESSSESSESEEEFFVSSVVKHVDRVHQRVNDEVMWSKEVNVAGTKVNFKLDSGAEVSVIPLNIFQKIDTDAGIKKSNMTLVSYGDPNFKIRPCGEVSLPCQVAKKSACLPFVIVNSKNQMPLLGLKGCLDLDLMRRVDSCIIKFQSLNDIEKLYPQVFMGLGCFPGKHKIILKKDAVPQIQMFRRIPQALNSRVKNKLDDLERQGIIRKVEKPTEWLNPLVIVEKKNGDLRLCLCPKKIK